MLFVKRNFKFIYKLTLHRNIEISFRRVSYAFICCSKSRNNGTGSSLKKLFNFFSAIPLVIYSKFS